MACEIKFSMLKNPPAGIPSPLNEQMLTLFNDKVPGSEGLSTEYKNLLPRLQEFYQSPFNYDTPENAAKTEKIAKGIGSTNHAHVINPTTGEPVLFQDQVGGYYFLRPGGKRLYVKEAIITETERIKLIRSLAFAMVNENTIEHPKRYIKNFLLAKKKAYLEVHAEKIGMARESRSDLVRAKALAVEANRNKNLAVKIDSILEDDFLFNSIGVGVNSAVKHSQLQYDKDLILEDSLLEEKEFSMGIENYIKSSDEVSDDSTIDPDIFKILSTVVDFTMDKDGKVEDVRETLFGMKTAKSFNEVKNRVLDVVNNILETYDETTGEMIDPYQNMITALNKHASDYNDELIKRFLENLNDVYDSKSPEDKLAFQVKFFKSFSKGVNTFILTEINTSEINSTSNKIVLKMVDPSVVQNKRGLVTQEWLTQIMLSESMLGDTLRDEMLNLLQNGVTILSTDMIRNLLDLLKVNYTDSTIDLMYKNQHDISKFGDRTVAGTPTLFNLFKKLISTDLENRLVYKSAGELKGKNDKNSATTREAFQMIADPNTSPKDVVALKKMIGDHILNAPLSILANFEALSRPSLVDSNYNIAGKSRYKYSNQNNINKKIMKWQSGDFSDLEIIKEKNLPYVNYLLATEYDENHISEEELFKVRMNRISKLRLVTNAQLRDPQKDTASEHKEIGEGDLMFDQMFKIMNVYDEMWSMTDQISKNNERIAYYRDAIRSLMPYNMSADKGGSYGLYGFDDVQEKRGVPHDMDKSNIHDMFIGEMNTMRKHSAIVRNLLNNFNDLVDDKGEIIQKNLDSHKDYVATVLTEDVHFAKKVSGKLKPADVNPEIENRPGESVSITHTYNPITGITTIKQVHMIETEVDGKKETVPYTGEDSVTITVDHIGLHHVNLNKNLWSKFGFFNSFLKGNEKQFEKFFDYHNETLLLKEDIYEQIYSIPSEDTDVPGESIKDIVEKGFDALVEENFVYISNMIGNNIANTDTNINGSKLEASVKEFAVKSILNNVQQFQMFNGDLMYYKQRGDLLSMEDALKRGPAAMSDGLQAFITDRDSDGKILKGTYKTISGRTVEYNSGRQFITAIVEKIDVDDSRFLSNMNHALNSLENVDVKLLKDYGHEIADAAGYITLEHFYNLRSKYYGLTEKDKEHFKNLMNPNYKPTAEDFAWMHIAANTHQPVKMMGFSKKKIDVEIDDEIISYELAVMLKYAPVILIPSLIAGTPMEKFNQQMIEQGVDQAVFKSGSKGANQVATRIHDMDGDLYKGLKNEIVFNPFTYDYTDLKWQVELPTHFDSEGAAGTQHVKNLIANLDMTSNKKSYTYKFKKYTASEIFNFYQDTIKDLLAKQSSSFLEKYNINIDENGTVNLNNSKLRELLIGQMDINEDYGLIKILKDPTMPVETIPGAAQRLFPILAGFIHKKVGKIRTNTGSVIQVANIGFDSLSTSIKNHTIYFKNDVTLKPPLPITGLNLKVNEIDRVEGLDEVTAKELKEYARLLRKESSDLQSNDLNRMQELAEKHSKSYIYYHTTEKGGILASIHKKRTVNDVTTIGTLKIDSAKVMMPFASIEKKLGMSWEQFQVEIVKSKELWAQGKGQDASISEELFKNIISYRIPNQSISSNDTLEIVGILPPYAGDQAIVYHEITKKTGSDFDVDKLYLMLPSFSVKKGNITKHLYETYVGRGTSIEEAGKRIYDLLASEDPENDISQEEIHELLLGHHKNVTEEADFRRNEEVEQKILDVILASPDDTVMKTNLEADTSLKVVSVEYAKGDTLKGKQNDLIELMQSILQSEDTYEDLMSPLDNDLVRDAMYEVLYEQYLDQINKSKIEEDGETTPNSDLNDRNEIDNEDEVPVMSFKDFKAKQISPLSQMSPMLMVKNRVDMLKAKKLVATMANHMTDIAMTQIQNITFFKELGGLGVDFSKIYMDPTDAYKHSEDASDYNNFRIKLTNVVSYFMNAAVDAAKDNYIIEGNFNSYTAGAAMLMIRSGMTPKQVFKVLLNPTILKMSNYKQAQTDVTANIKLKDHGYDEASMDNATNEYLKYLNDNPRLRNTGLESLLEEIADNEMLVKGFWNLLIKGGKEMTAEITVSKSDSNGAGKNLNEFISLLGNLEIATHSNFGATTKEGDRVLMKIYKNGVPRYSTPSTDFISPTSTRYKDLTFMGAMQNNSLYLTKAIAKNLFIEATDGYYEGVKHALALTGRPMAFSEATVKEISQSLYPIVLGHSDFPVYNIRRGESNGLIKTAERVLDLIKVSSYKHTSLVKNLHYNATSKKLEFAPGKKINASDLSMMREEMELMYLDPKTSSYIVDLIRYSFVTTGLKPAIGSFNHILPRTYFIELGNHLSIQKLLNMLNNPNNEATFKEIGEQSVIRSVISNPKDFKLSNVIRNFGPNRVTLTDGEYTNIDRVINPESGVAYPFVTIIEGKSTEVFMLNSYAPNKNNEFKPVYKKLVQNRTDVGDDVEIKLYDTKFITNGDIFDDGTTYNHGTISYMLLDHLSKALPNVYNYYNYSSPLNKAFSILKVVNEDRDSVRKKVVSLAKSFGSPLSTDEINDIVKYLIDSETGINGVEDVLTTIENYDEDQFKNVVEIVRTCNIKR